jgi:uncharacterized protein (AIM24 family)
VQNTAQDNAANRPFELENPHLPEVNLHGRVWAKVGAMVAYTGQVKFTCEGALEHGLQKALKNMLTGEGASLMKMEGQGRVYLIDPPGHARPACFHLPQRHGCLVWLALTGHSYR